MILRFSDKQYCVGYPIRYPLAAEQTEFGSLRSAPKHLKANKPIGRIFKHSIHVIMEGRRPLPRGVREKCLRVHIPVNCAQLHKLRHRYLFFHQCPAHHIRKNPMHIGNKTPNNITILMSSIRASRYAC
jgi:hypothetical protein